MDKNFVYIIKGTNTNNKIKYYIGYTNNPIRRIRQHNCELVGGAKATKGYKWEYCGLITNFRDNIEGLQIEWRLKHSTKKTGIINKINSFIEYVDLHLKASPKNSQMIDKFYMSLNYNLLPNINIISSVNIIIINKEINNEDILL
jgi:structure-specific endonuclease subunit SLX1